MTQVASVYDDIRAALEYHLSTMADVPEISYENVSYDPPQGADWLKCQLIPTSRKPAVRGLNPQMRYQGLFTIFCYTPEGIGPSRADDLADKVVDHFEATTDVTHPSIPAIIISVDYAEREQGQNKQPYYYTVVNIGWYFYK